MQTANYTSRFSGHETFPLRYGWLYKAVNEVKQGRTIRSSKKADIEQAVINMGVGKNMVSSIRYWADICQIITSDSDAEHLTPLAAQLFGGEGADESKGWDPYLEDPATVWLLHWLINSNYTELSATRWFFNYFNGQRFDKKLLTKRLNADLARFDVALPADKTLEKDIDCLIQTYTSRISDDKKITEDSFSSPLTELGLLHSGEGKTFRAELADHSSLPDNLFVYALISYWKVHHPHATTLSFDGVLSAAGSPARVFRLSQSALGTRIDRAQQLTDGKISWTDTQGLRGVMCQDLNSLDADSFLEAIYAEANV